VLARLATGNSRPELGGFFVVRVGPSSGIAFPMITYRSVMRDENVLGSEQRTETANGHETDSAKTVGRAGVTGNRVNPSAKQDRGRRAIFHRLNEPTLANVNKKK